MNAIPRIMAATNEDARSELSSSSISSPPISPKYADASDTLHLPAPVRDTEVKPNPAQAASNAAPANKPKRQRKKKELDPDGKPIDDGKPKEKKPRKPREPKEKPNGASPAVSKKKTKTEDAPTNVSRQPTIHEMVNNYPPPTAAAISIPQAATPRPATSGLRYDPIRGIDVENFSRPSPLTTPAVPNPTISHLTAPVNRASASPSIASLLDNSTTASKPLLSPQSTIVQQTTMNTLPTQHLSPTPSKVIAPEIENAMDIDSKPSMPRHKSPDAKAPSKASSTAPTPKPTPAQPVGTGSGLLSSSDLFGGPSTSDGSSSKGVNIDIQIKLNPAGGNHINVAQEIIKKYGRDALYPRAAAHRERLLQVMATANKLDGGSADDMSIDLMSEGEGDSNVEMGGMDDGSGAVDGDKPRKRRKKAEEYDLDDEFIDDTELAWQQQAAVAKDGFFVYSGPLITDVEAARAEATSSGSRGGRGRGRGRGSRGGAASTHASFAEKKEPATSTTTTSGRGRGRGRGTGAPRKPRITKADKEKLDAEKAGREKAATNTTTPAPMTNSPAPSNHILHMTHTPTSLSTAT